MVDEYVVEAEISKSDLMKQGGIPDVGDWIQPYEMGFLVRKINVRDDGVVELTLTTYFEYSGEDNWITD